MSDHRVQMKDCRKPLPFHRGTIRNLVLAYRSFVVIGTQLILILAANVTAFELRFEGEIPPEYARRSCGTRCPRCF